MKAWRLVSEKWASGAFTGDGARLYGGRWNFPGIPLVYAAERLSLAALEMLVHLKATSLSLPYVAFEIEFEDSLLTAFPENELPEHWREEPVSSSTMEVGTYWATRRESAVLAVPSVVVPEERNFLLNCEHPQFPKIYILREQAFSFDPRLLKENAE